MIDNKFKLVSYLGKGGSSKVFLAKDKLRNKYAIKIVRKDKKYSTAISEKLIMTEHQVLINLKYHPNIIKSYEINLDGTATMENESENIMYNVLEYAENGPLSNFVRYTGAIEEGIACFFILQLCSAIEYMHLQGYAHLDIKLENILLDEFFNIKLADMGGSVFVRDTCGFSNKRRGTALYMPPEIYEISPGDVYDAFKADVYSLGIAIFVILIGEFPHPSDFIKSCSTDESDNTKSFNSECFTVSQKIRIKWSCLSEEMQDLIKSMTHKTPKLRPSISEIYKYFCLSYEYLDEKIEDIYNEMHYRRLIMEEYYRNQEINSN